MDFTAFFFSHGREVADLIEAIALGRRSEAKLEAKITAIEQDLSLFEQDHSHQADELALVLVQQLRLIVQMLPQLQNFVGMEKIYHQKRKAE